MKKIILIFIFMFIFSLPASADFYEDQLSQSGVDSLYESLPENAEDFLNQNDISLSQSDWVNKIRAGNIFSWLWDTLKAEGKTPFITGAGILGTILLLAAARLFSDKAENEQTVLFIGTCVCAGAVLLPLFRVITSAARTLKAGAEFMLAFIPIYGTVLTAAGKPLTGTFSSSLLLGASEGVVWLASSIITPLIGAYLAICMCANLCPAINISGVSEFVKKTATWAIGLIMTVYIGILGMQTTVNAAADSLAIRTGKFMLGSFIPVVGGPVSEALTTVQSCMGVLHSSVGVFGIVGLALLLLPALVELLLWRAVLLLCSGAATCLENSKVATLLKAADSAVSFILGIMLLCAVAFIFSLTVVVKAGT